MASPPPPPPQQYQQQPYQNGNGNYEFSPPRPYVWKTDEFQVSENKARRQPTQQKNFQPINQVQPLAPPPAPFVPQPLVHQQQNLAFRTGCPRCGGQHYPRLEKKISTAGWIVFAVLLVTFFPLFWIGFLIKENQSFCPVCNFRLS